MKTRGLLLIGCAGIGFVVVLVLAWSAYWEHKETPFRNAPELIRALQAFARDQAAAGRLLPPEVSLTDLVRGGYLTADDVRAFEGMDVTFSTQPDNGHPQMILARARMPDGQFICVLADGSVQQLSRRKYEELHTGLGQSGPAGESQPFSSGTNRAPRVDGSGQ
jgi:hypothetical protein